MPRKLSAEFLSSFIISIKVYELRDVEKSKMERREKKSRLRNLIIAGTLGLAGLVGFGASGGCARQYTADDFRIVGREINSHIYHHFTVPIDYTFEGTLTQTGVGAASKKGGFSLIINLERGSQ